jgi:hypothetical protein
MNDRFFDLAAAALDYVAAIKCESSSPGDAIADLAAAAVAFAAASPPKPEGLDDDTSDCAYG